MSVEGEVRTEPVDIRGDISVAFRGKDGLSAYEVAVKNGFAGTEQEWLESLKGEAAKAEAFTNEAKEYWHNAQASAIQAGNSAREAAIYRHEVHDMMEAFAPDVADARAAIQAEKEEAEQKKLLVDEAAEYARLDRIQADADAAEVRYLLGRTTEEKNVATDAAERARMYADGRWYFNEMTIEEANEGTNTIARTLSAKTLADYVDSEVNTIVNDDWLAGIPDIDAIFDGVPTSDIPAGTIADYSDIDALFP